jgi:hypothetical protein
MKTPAGNTLLEERIMGIITIIDAEPNEFVRRAFG